MSGRESIVEPDRWTLPRRQTFGLRGRRVLPGPLKTLTRRRRSPVWLAGIAGLGCAGLALAAAVTLSPRKAETAVSEPVPAQTVADIAVPRVVGPVAPPAAPAPATVEQPALRSTTAEPEPAPPTPRHAAAPALDLGQLPVLALDATAFEAPSVAEAPRPTTRPPARTPAPRLATQP